MRDKPYTYCILYISGDITTCPLARYLGTEVKKSELHVMYIKLLKNVLNLCVTYTASITNCEGAALVCNAQNFIVCTCTASITNSEDTGLQKDHCLDEDQARMPPKLRHKCYVWT